MASPNRASSSGPAESRLLRTLLYAAEGAMLGGGCYYVVSLSVLAFAGIDRWFAAVVVLLFTLVGGRTWAVVSANRASRPPIHHEWTAVRHRGVVALVGMVVAGLLVGVTALVWGWRGVSGSEAGALGFGAFMLGFVLRVGVRDLLSHESETDTTT